MTNSDNNRPETIAEFLTCTRCKGRRWMAQELAAEAMAAKELSIDQRRAVTVSIIEFRDLNKNLQAGQQWTVAYVVRDVCMDCGNEQVIRLEKTRGRAVMRSGIALPKDFMPPRGQGMGG